jgi:ubiquinone/menaquinone biosynthesis C-methylase UbiE
MEKQMTKIDQELSRLKSEYRWRDSGNIPADRYSHFNESTLLHSQSLERNLLALLRRHGCTDLHEKKILDVGCGTGGHLQRFLDYGAISTNLFGIDLMAHRIEQAKQRHPAINWQVGSAHRLPYKDANFDLVTSFVVFSSILDESLRRQIAREIWRVLKPGGLILLHDFIYSNPRNPAVQGISHRQILNLFEQPGANFDFRRITLAPPLSRIVAPRAYWLAFMLEHLKILNTHTIGIISESRDAFLAPSYNKEQEGSFRLY